MSHFTSPPGPRYSEAKVTNSDGLWSGAVPAGLKYYVQPMTTGEFANSITLVGTTLTVQFRKFKAAGLGITLGTLLTVSAFEDSSGVASFNLIGADPTT